MTRSEQWTDLLRQLSARQQSAEAMGGTEKVALQHAKGRFTARERIDRLFDTGTFNEIGALAGGSHPGGGITGAPGKCPGKCGSLNVTFLIVTMRCPGSSSSTRSTSRNG